MTCAALVNDAGNCQAEAISSDSSHIRPTGPAIWDGWPAEAEVDARLDFLHASSLRSDAYVVGVVGVVKFNACEPKLR